jgi:hypothetical protein
VSAYLQSLEQNPLFNKPELDYVRTAQTPASATEPYEFSIDVKLRQAVTDDEDMGYDSADTGGAP